jgi:hypothetical protein
MRFGAAAAAAAALLPLITEFIIELVNEFMSIFPPTGMVNTGVAFSAELVDGATAAAVTVVSLAAAVSVFFSTAAGLGDACCCCFLFLSAFDDFPFGDAVVSSLSVLLV